MTEPIDEMIATLRALGKPDAVESDAAEAAVPYVQTAMAASLSAGTTPEGTPWAPTKSGGRAYAGAAGKLKVTASGNLLSISVSGGEAWGNDGVKGHLPVRRMLPEHAGNGLPPIIAEAIQKALADAVAKAGQQ